MAATAWHTDLLAAADMFFTPTKLMETVTFANAIPSNDPGSSA
jgi:hypothetical protein